MEHIEIEKQINEILKPLELELKESGAMDLTGKAIDEKLFESVIDNKIKELNRLEYLVADEAGVAKDRYAANILFHNIEMLNEMRNNHTFHFEPNKESLQRGAEQEEKLFKKQKFTDGIRRLLQKFSGRRRTIENER